jgi:MtrB/PioB family decaheme-associated outer membrane protein
MGQARRWASVALSGLVAASLCLVISGPALAGEAGTDVLGWDVSGSVEAGGIYSFGERGSSKFNQYQDMDNGFVGELSLRGEKKDQPYFFELGAKNPARDDQSYEGEFGRYGLFRLDLGWDRTPHVLSNSAQTIYQQNGDTFSLPSSNRAAIATTFTTTPTTVAGRAAISAQINGLLRPVDLGFNTDVGKAGFKYTPLEDLRFDIEYQNIRREGKRPLGAQMAGSTSGPIQELAVPIENYTNEVKVGGEYARANWGLQFGYTGSFFHNQYTGYTWDTPTVAANTGSANATERVSAAPDNSAHTFNVTGTTALPLRTRLNGTFAYTMLRQDETFLYSTANPLLTRTNADDSGNTSPDAKANLVLGNIVLTSRPINNVTATARYRYFEYQNDTPFHAFTNDVYVGGGTSVGSATTKKERYTKQNAGFDLGWHPMSMLNLKAGYEFEHWSRADFGELGDTGATDQNFSNHEHIGKFSADATPVDWFLGRLTYTYGYRKIYGYNTNPSTDLAGSIKYNYADRRRHRVDALFQFSPWETFAPSVSAGYAIDDFPNNQFGLLKNDYWTVGVNLDWRPVKWLTFTADYTYEQYNYDMMSRYLVGGTYPGFPYNNWKSNSKDEFHNVGVNALVDVVPKRFDVTLGYAVTFGYTTFDNSNPNLNAGGTTSVPQAVAYSWDKVSNILQTFKIVGRYRLTEKLSLRGGFAYERYTENNWAIDPMAPFMGNYDTDRPGGSPITAGVQSVWLGATQPNYEAYTLGCIVRYDF